MSGIGSIGSGLVSLWNASEIGTGSTKSRDVFGRIQKQLDEKQEKSNQAKSAGLENSTFSPVTSSPIVFQTSMADTLWQTLSFAQSAESHAVNAEEVITTNEEDISSLEQKKSAADEFLEYMNRPTEDLLREAILKELGYSEEDLEKLEPKERVKVEAKIKELIEQKIEESMKEDGFEIDLSGAQPINQIHEI